MTQIVGIAKVARALNLNRAELRQRIENAGITTFDGMINVDDLRAVAPTFGLQESELMERLRLLRENARELRHDPTAKPPAEDLTQQVRNLKVEHLLAKRRFEHCQSVMDALLKHLGEMLGSENLAHQQVARELNVWFADRIESQ